MIGFATGRVAILRLEIHPDGTGELFATQTKFGQTGIQFSKEVSVSATGVSAFLEDVAQANFWTMPYKPIRERLVLDGSGWYFEGARGSEYHLVYRSNPQLSPGPFTEVGRYLGKDLAQLPDSIISIPRWERPVLVRHKPRD